jgi:hypothetical protein
MFRNISKCLKAAYTFAAYLSALAGLALLVAVLAFPKGAYLNFVYANIEEQRVRFAAALLFGRAHFVYAQPTSPPDLARRYRQEHDWPEMKERFRWGARLFAPPDQPDPIPTESYWFFHAQFHDGMGGVDDVVSFPAWIIGVVLLLPSALVLPGFLKRRRNRKRSRLGLCLRCGYDLRFSQGVCPECGTPMSTRSVKEFLTEHRQTHPRTR